MYILAMETTGPKGSAALIDEKGQVTMRVSAEKMNHLKDLMPMAEALLAERGISKGELSAVAASMGPGSFTGIRIGVASARAVAQALDIPAVAVPTLDSFRLKKREGCLTVPIFNARRGQVYGAVFDENGEAVLESGPYMLTDCFAALKKYADDWKAELSCGMGESLTVEFFGDGIDAYEKDIESFGAELAEAYAGVRVILADVSARYQDASMTAVCALDRYQKGEVLSPEALLPDYMRVTEAEQKLRDGSLAKERAARMARFRAR